jgi:hypothetical protein
VSITDTCRFGRYGSQDIGDVVEVMSLGGASGLACFSVGRMPKGGRFASSPEANAGAGMGWANNREERKTAYWRAVTRKLSSCWAKGGRRIERRAVPDNSNEARHRRTRHLDVVREGGGVQGSVNTWRRGARKKGISARVW